MAVEVPGGPGWKAMALTAEVTSVLQSVEPPGILSWGVTRLEPGDRNRAEVWDTTLQRCPLTTTTYG